MGQSVHDTTIYSHLMTLVAQIPYRHRMKVKTEIRAIQKALKLPDNDLCIDRRTLRSLSNDPGRLKFKASMKTMTQTRKTHVIEWRDGFGPQPCTIHEASTLLKRSVASLHVRLSKGGGAWTTAIDDRIVTLRRLSSYHTPIAS
jgi:hypothetical protein